MLPPVNFPTLGWQVIDWIETYLCHGPGDVQGELWTSTRPGLAIDDEEALFIAWAYRLWPQGHPKAGQRLVRRAIYSRPKGRRKSEIAGAIDCAEALGPVRCDGFDAHGEPVGVPVTAPFVRCMATEEEQSGNTYDNVRFMLEEGEAANAFPLDVGLTRTFLGAGGEIVPSTSGDASKDGGKESKATADETHLYILPNLRKMYGTVSRNTGKRKIAEPWLLDTTTAWLPGERSIAEQAADKYAHLPVEEAVTKLGVLYDHHQGPEPKRFGDNRSLKKALREAYGPAAAWMDFDRIVGVIRDAEDPEETAFRYFLNRPRSAASAWLKTDQIKAALRPDAEVAAGAKIGLGFDGSETDDHTALWGCTREGLLFPIGIWAPKAEDGIGWHTEVDEAVTWAFDHFDVVNFKFDPAYWIEEGSKWAARYGKRVEEFWTGGRSEGKFAIAAGACRTGIRQKTTTILPTPLRTPPLVVFNDEIREGTSGTPIAVWHFENARTRKVRVKVEDEPIEGAYTVRKERRGSPKKIDSVPAAVLARRARDDAETKGLFEAPQHEIAQWGGM